MTEANNNQAEAARILGLSYHQFRYFYKKLAIEEVETKAIG